jgi:hypothetical protein
MLVNIQGGAQESSEVEYPAIVTKKNHIQIYMLPMHCLDDLPTKFRMH